MEQKTYGNDRLSLGHLLISTAQGYHCPESKQADIFSPFVRVSKKIPHHSSNRSVEISGFVPISTKSPFFRKEKRLEIKVKIDHDNDKRGTETTVLSCLRLI